MSNTSYRKEELILKKYIKGFRQIADALKKMFQQGQLDINTLLETNAMKGLVRVLVRAMKKCPKSINKDTKPEIVIQSGLPDDSACTDGKLVLVTSNSDIVKTRPGGIKSTLTEQLYSIFSLLLHELGHVECTDFGLALKVNRELEDNKRFYVAEKIKDQIPHYDEVYDFYKTATDKGAAAFKELLNNVNNIVEDRYVDEAALETSVGYIRAYEINLSRALAMPYERMKALGDAAKVKVPEFREYALALDMFLNRVIYGKMEYQKANENEPIISTIRSLEPMIDTIPDTTSAYKRWAYTWYSLGTLWPFLRPYLEKLNENKSQEDKKNHKQGQRGRGQNTQPDYHNSSEPNESECPDSEQLNPNPQNNQGQQASGGSGKGKTKGKRKNQGKNQGQSQGENQGPDQGQSQGQQAQGQSNKGKGQKSSNASQGASKKEEDALSDAIKNACEELASGKDAEQLVNGLEWKYDIERSVGKEKLKGLPDAWIKESRLIGKRAASLFENEIKGRSRGGRMAGLYSGKKLTVSAIAKNQLGIFEKRIAPNQMPKIAITILVDGSGSMDGSRILNAKRAAITVAEFCEALHLPYQVACHRQVRANYYGIVTDFDDKKPAYNEISSLSAGGGTNDAPAMTLAAQMLMSQWAKNHYLLFITDATACDFFMQRAYKQIKASGCLFTAVAVCENCRDNIAQFYDKEDILDATDVAKLPRLLMRAIGKHI